MAHGASSGGAGCAGSRGGCDSVTTLCQLASARCFLLSYDSTFCFGTRGLCRREIVWGHRGWRVRRSGTILWHYWGGGISFFAFIEEVTKGGGDPFELIEH